MKVTSSLARPPDPGARAVHDPSNPKAAVKDMFRRFWRAGEPDAQTPEGAGLGLAIADSVVRLHGGSIAAANDPAGGLLVTINLPVTQ